MNTKTIQRYRLQATVAFVANALVAIAKTVAAVLTGSLSMLAEAVHSWADTANECFRQVVDTRLDGPKRCP